MIITDSTYKIKDTRSYKLLGGDADQNERWHYYYTVSTQLFPAKGLKGAVSIIDLSMHYPACGYTGGNIVVVWDGSKQYYVFQDYDGSDAGVYSISSDYILPSNKGGKGNTILSYTNTISYEFDEKNEYKELEHDSIAIQYSWKKGNGIIKIDTLFTNNK